MEDEDDDNLVRGLAEDLFEHINSEQWIRFLLRLAIEECFRGRVSRKRKRGEGVHDEVNPKKLHGAEDSLLSC